MLEENNCLEVVELIVDIPEYDLQKGRIVTLVDMSSRNDSLAVEFRDIDTYSYRSATLYPHQLKNTTKSLSEGGLPLLGLRHFLRVGYSDYSLFAIKAPLSKTADSFAKSFGYKKWEQNVAKKKLEYEDENHHSNIATFVQVAQSEWTVIYRSFELCLLDKTVEEAQFLSDYLQTESICVLEDDTSVSTLYRHYKNGEETECIDFFEDQFIFRSTFRDHPEIDFDTEDEKIASRHAGPSQDFCFLYSFKEYLDSIIRDLGIYIPVCYPAQNEILSVYGVSLEAVERADIMLL